MDPDFVDEHVPVQEPDRASPSDELSSAEDQSRNNKRPIQDCAAHRPFKRQKGGGFNADYLELLNRDIDDAAHMVCLDDDFDLPRTQIGLTVWSPLEKRQFFEALARLGRHDLPGIASRVNSKSTVEIKHYIDILRDGLRRRRLQRHSLLQPAEYPAAVELSQPCCHAQEEAADAVALRQEHRETQREEKKWGCHWNVSPTVAQRLDQGYDADVHRLLPFAQLFHLRRWLRLSERFFMNSSIPGGNWIFVDHAPPSVWATAFEDFYSLVVSITRRLVQTTLFISMSRIRAKRELLPSTRDIVRKRDAEAAIVSLGMTANAQQFWLKSARRLRLNVYQELSDQGEESDEEPMSYDQVESSLSEGDEDKPAEAPAANQEAVPDRDQDDLSDDSREDHVSPEEQEQRDIRREANELLWRSAADLQDLPSARRALERSIAVERRQAEQAEGRDEYASYQAEIDMWDVLQRKPPMNITKKQDPGPLKKFNMDVESLYPMKRDWTSQLKYRSEWETWDQGP